MSTKAHKQSNRQSRTSAVEHNNVLQQQPFSGRLDTAVLTSNDIVQLQRTLGNRAVNTLLSRRRQHTAMQPNHMAMQRRSAQPASIQRATNSVIQLERFIGDPAKHHLHVEINQDHYKFGNDKGSRIELGKNGVYKLDQLIAARNYLVNESPGGSGHDACVEWLEQECRDHNDWDGDVGFVPSWEQEEGDKNAHVDGILEYGESLGFKRSDFENAFIQAKDETYEEVTNKMENYPEGTTEEELQEVIDGVELKQVLASWSGFDHTMFRKDELTDHFKSGVREYIRNLLFDEFPLMSNKYIESYSGVKVGEV